MTKLKSAEEWEEELMDINKYPTTLSCTRAIQQNAIEAAIAECEIELFAITQDQDLVNAVGNVRNGKALRTQTEKPEKQKEFDKFIDGMAKIIGSNSQRVEG